MKRSTLESRNEETGRVKLGREVALVQCTSIIGDDSLRSLNFIKKTSTHYIDRFNRKQAKRYGGGYMGHGWGGKASTGIPRA